MSVQQGTFVAGIVLGSIVIMAVCWTYIRKGTLGAGGTVLSVVGLVLVGLSLWSGIEIKAGDLSVKLDTAIDQVAVVAEQVETLATTTETARQQLLQLAAVVDQPPAIQRQRAAVIRSALDKAPVVDPRRLAAARKELEALKSSRVAPVNP